jgi:hypothetical protein
VSQVRILPGAQANMQLRALFEQERQPLAI